MSDLQKQLDTVNDGIRQLTGPEPPGLSEADRERRARNLAALQAERRDLQQQLGQQPGDAGRTPPWVRQDDGSYQLSDGRTVTFDLATGSTRVFDPDNAPLGGPREQIVQVDAHGREYVLVGLYTDPARSPAGVVMLREGSDAERQAAARRVAQLREKAQRQGLTAAEAAELNDLTRALAGQTALTLGLPGGGTFTDARSRVVHTDAQGGEYVLAMGDQRQLHASVTGIVPRTQGEWNALYQGYRQEEARLVGEIQSLRARIATVEAGHPDPGPDHFLVVTGSAALGRK